MAWMVARYSLVHYHRNSEAAAYCPSLKDVVPCATAGGVDGEGVPRWITISYAPLQHNEPRCQ